MSGCFEYGNKQVRFPSTSKTFLPTFWQSSNGSQCKKKLYEEMNYLTDASVIHVLSCIEPIGVWNDCQNVGKNV